jgi:predicted nucleic acid-binding protein
LNVYADTSFLRTLDIVHVASALLLKPEVFYTFDRRQSKLARAEQRGTT